MTVRWVVVRPEYSGERWERLEVLAGQLARLRAEVEARFVSVDELAPRPPTQAWEVTRWVDRMLNGSSGPVLVYLGGHGVMSRRSYYVALDDTPRQGAYVSNAVWAAELCDVLSAHAPDVVLVIDACFAGQAIPTSVTQAAQALAERVEAARFGVVASCRAVHGAGSIDDGAFLEALAQIMREGPVGDVTAWGQGDELIPLGPLVEELRHRQVPVADALLDGAYALRVVPNLGYRPDQPPQRVAVLLTLRRLSHGAENHLLEKSDTFVGRTALRTEISEWLTQGSSPLFVITGSPGTGKSALIGLLARQSVDDEQARSLDGGRPVPVGAFDVIVHAQQKTLGAVREELAEALGHRPAGEGPATVLVDALDGAVAGEAVGIAAHLSAEVRAGRIRLVVGTRPAPVVGAPGGHDPLLHELTASAPGHVLRDLDDVAGTREDIARLVREALVRRRDVPYDDGSAEEVAVEVAELTTPNFLFAHAALRWLTSQAGRITDRRDWRRFLRSYVSHHSLGRLIEHDLIARYHGDDLSRVRDLLRALAWAEGLGIPRYTIWPTFADALAPTPTRYSDPDITWVLNEAGWYITEATEDGQSVYRLFHQSLTEWFRHQTPR